MTRTPAPPPGTGPIGPSGSSTRPYLVRALHEWCSDNGFTPYIAVFVDASVRVPMEYVKNNEIVLNVGLEATTALKLGNDYIEFKARFGGISRDISVPVDHVIAIYARENGQGMAFPVPSEIPAGITPAPVPAEAGGGGAERASNVLRLANEGDQPRSASSATDAGATVAESAEASDPTDSPEPPESPGPGSRPSLKRVK